MKRKDYFFNKDSEWNGLCNECESTQSLIQTNSYFVCRNCGTCYNRVLSENEVRAFTYEEKNKRKFRENLERI